MQATLKLRPSVKATGMIEYILFTKYSTVSWVHPVVSAVISSNISKVTRKK